MDTRVWPRGEGGGGERGIESLEPDHMTPDQFAGLIHRRSWQDGERRLMAAVLQDAVETFHKHAFSDKEDGREQFDEVHRWIVDREDRSLFAFSTICEALDVEPDYLRGGLLRWLEQNRRQPMRIAARFLGDPRRRVQRAAAGF